MKTETMTQYPDCYLHVQDCHSGETWIMPIRGNATLDLERLIKKWVKLEFCGQLALDGRIQPRLEGDFYARIMTDSRPPESAVCWSSGGFWLKTP